MLKLLFLLCCLTLGSILTSHPPHLIIFTSQGAYYKLDPQTKHAEWHKSLGQSLLSFELDDSQPEGIPPSYILPTLDGHFLYIDTKNQILIKREEVEQLLNICLDGSYRQKELRKDVEYFIYEKFQYYIINLKNGIAQDIQTFLKNGIPKNMDHYIVLKNTKKYLKQLKKDLSVAWSTISSDLQLFPASNFLIDPKITTVKDLSLSKISFRRVKDSGIEMINGGQIFQITGKSHILSVFQFINPEKGYLKHPLNYYQQQKLALEYVPQQNQHEEYRDLIESNRLKLDKTNTGFIHSDQIKTNKKPHQSQQSIEQCVSIFRTLQAISDDSKNVKITTNHHQHHPNLDNNSLSFASYKSPIEPIVITYGPTQNQPYIWIALVIMVVVVLVIIGIASVFYRKKINSLKKEISAMQSKTGEQFMQVQKKLGQVQELKKMYEVYWDKIIYQVAGEHWFQHMVFQGKFLNQPASVFAVRLEGTDVVSLEHKLNIFLNFSHKGLCKLYYYTKNTEFLLIFTEKVDNLSKENASEYLKKEVHSTMKKNLIKSILEAVSYLDSKLEIHSLPFEALSIIHKQVSQGDSYFDFKLNSVPCLLKKPLDDSDIDEERSCSADSSTYDLRINLVVVFHLIIHEGEPFSKQLLDQKLKNQAYSQDEYLQFFDFVIYEAKSKIEKDIEGGSIPQNSRQLMFKDIIDHPYLWDSKRKILFLSDFSNYIETHIDESKVKKLESHAKEYNVIKTPWIKEFHFTFMREVSNYRKYDYESVRDLIRLIRNKLNHFHEIPKDVKIQIGKTPQGFIEYCLDLFPKLLHFAFVYTRKKKWKLHMK